MASRIESLGRERDDFRLRLKQTQEKIESIRAQVEQMEASSFEEHKKALLEGKEIDTSQTRGEIRKLQDQAMDLHDSERILEQEIHRVDQDLLQEELRLAVKERDSLVVQRKNLLDRLEKLRRDVTDAEKEYEGTNIRIDGLNQRCESLQKNLDGWSPPVKKIDPTESADSRKLYREWKEIGDAILRITREHQDILEREKYLLPRLSWIPTEPHPHYPCWWGDLTGKMICKMSYNELLDLRNEAMEEVTK